MTLLAAKTYKVFSPGLYIDTHQPAIADTPSYNTETFALGANG